MLVRRKLGDEERVAQYGWRIGTKIKTTLDRLPLRRYSSRNTDLFSINWVPNRLVSRINEIAPDVVHLHWIGKGFLRIEDLADVEPPIVWTLHDMWPFTGGCHYSGGCTRYIDSCGVCPALDSNSENDLSSWVWSRKARNWSDINLSLVSPSSWLADRIRESSVFRNRNVKVIPNGLDVKEFRPGADDEVGDRFGFDENRPIVLFGAVSATSDPRKGFDELVEALSIIDKRIEATDFQVGVFGNSDDESEIDVSSSDINFLGYVEDYEMSSLFALADLMVVPSLQDNLPNTVLEALACGTPVVAFKVGGIPEMVVHKFNGYLASPHEPKRLADGIAWVLREQSRYTTLGEQARKSVEKRHSLETVAEEYRSLYEDVSK